MKKLITIALFVMACGGGSKKPETTTTDPNTPTSNTDGTTGAGPTGAGTPCEQEIALVCPDGQIDGCLKTPREGTTHACVAK